MIFTFDGSREGRASAVLRNYFLRFRFRLRCRFRFRLLTSYGSYSGSGSGSVTLASGCPDSSSSCELLSIPADISTQPYVISQISRVSTLVYPTTRGFSLAMVSQNEHADLSICRFAAWRSIFLTCLCFCPVISGMELYIK